jgi:hypothetical protein
MKAILLAFHLLQNFQVRAYSQMTDGVTTVHLSSSAHSASYFKSCSISLFKYANVKEVEADHGSCAA